MGSGDGGAAPRYRFVVATRTPGREKALATVMLRAQPIEGESNDRVAARIMLVIAVIAACVLIARPARRTDARSRIVVPPGELRPRNQVLDDSGYAPSISS